MGRHLLAVVALLACTAAAHAQDFQVGARAKGMGGSYTAFEDDPISVWLNPAGIATQSLQLGVAYQTYTQYEFDFEKTDQIGDPEMGFINPNLLPSFIGLTYQLGTPEKPMAFGFAFVRPVHIKMTYDFDPGGDDGVQTAEFIEDQSFSRLRFAYAIDFRMRAPGEAGFLPHVAVGLGLDIAHVVWEENGGTPDSNTGFGAGLGILAALFDNTETFKMTVGFAYQSAVKFDFQRDTSLFPIWNWPTMFNGGVTIYLGQGMPLRITADVQMIDWKKAVDSSTLAGHDDFRSVTNISFGAEYRLKLREDGSLLLYPRAGIRLLEGIWDDKNNLPAIGDNILAIDTKDDKFTVATVGMGLYWTTADGKTRGVDLGFEFGGDSTNLSFGYTHEF